MYLGSWISASELTIAMEYCSSGDLFNFIAKRRVVLPAASRPRQSSGADGAGPAHGHDGAAHGYVKMHNRLRIERPLWGIPGYHFVLNIFLAGWDGIHGFE